MFTGKVPGMAASCSETCTGWFGGELMEVVSASGYSIAIIKNDEKL
jgi:hypothetical protein